MTFPGLRHTVKEDAMKKPSAVAILLACCLLCLRPAVGLAQTEVLVIPGTGDSQAVLRGLAEAFMRANPGARVEVPDSVGSSGGRKAVLDGKATLGRVANSSTEKEAAGGLAYLEFARTPVVFAVHPGVEGVVDITPEQALGVYSGTIRDWSGLGGRPGKIYPLAREEGDSSWQIVREKLPGFKDVAAPAGKVFYTTPETVRALEEHAGTIAFGPLAMFTDRKARVLSLEGIPPLGSDYPLFTRLGLIWKGKPGPLAQRFLDFVRGPQGAAVIRRNSCVPVGQGD